MLEMNAISTQTTVVMISKTAIGAYWSNTAVYPLLERSDDGQPLTARGASDSDQRRYSAVDHLLKCRTVEFEKIGTSKRIITITK
jgi:hypothetical protein